MKKTRQHPGRLEPDYWQSPQLKQWNQSREKGEGRQDLPFPLTVVAVAVIAVLPWQFIWLPLKNTCWGRSLLSPQRHRAGAIRLILVFWIVIAASSVVSLLLCDRLSPSNTASRVILQNCTWNHHAPSARVLCGVSAPRPRPVEGKIVLMIQNYDTIINTISHLTRKVTLKSFK